MALRDDFHQQIAAVTDRRAPISDLYAWMSRHLPALARTADPALAELDGEVWQLLTEYSDGVRDEAAVREELRNLTITAPL